MRYEQFRVCVQNGRGEALSLLQPATMTEWERERERVEFERATLLFRPMKGDIGSRFVSAGGSEEVDSKVGEMGEEAGERELRRAADMKMFGQLTRTTEDWHPARLLCVRFNVAQPYGDPSVVGTRDRASKKRETGEVFGL